MDLYYSVIVWKNECETYFVAKLHHETRNSLYTKR